MRIAYVCTDPGVPVFGAKGASVHVQEVLRVLVGRGAEVELFCVRTGGAGPGDLAGVRVHELPLEPSRDPVTRELAAMRADAALARAVAARGGFDLVYERYALWGRSAMPLARAMGVPGVLEVNAPLVEEQERYRGLVHRSAAVESARTALGAAAAVVAVSDPVAAWARGHGARAVHVVPNGVDVARVRPAPAEPAGPFTVGFVGTVKRWHGLDTLLDAFRLLCESGPARLLIVGDGPEAGRLAERAAALGLAARTELTGALPPSQVPALLHRMHAAVAPYPPADSALGSYFSPLKIYEYLAAGLPVVATEVGQAAQIITHGTDGLLSPPGDAEALAGALARLRADAPLRARLGAAARRTAVRRHGWDRTVDRSLAAAGLRLGRRVRAA
ncbi:glycosyltransferase family 4 protein [Allonocardiopsis opalescens]|uniref:Glycosyltransferase involved in cell wall biosynthesis n=1 Tax=Allonocardiopsis opalescens TaxID=1144618 RepID=A0A2T0Q000_9ACTN|nr:glycosyltransferase family 4 protein [Allonocardiopsis opalescens]PRX97129.1 glycosyltransferase involved in cell wall biosynthesis [Allonocardiopsis opalescens]